MSIIGKIKPGEIQWANDFEADRDDSKGKYTASWSYYCHETDIFKFMPATGAACVREGWEFLTVSNLEVTGVKAKVATIKVNFNGFPDGDPNEFDNNRKYKIDEITTTVQEPIETHPKFADLGGDAALGDAKEILSRYKSGEYKKVPGESYKFMPVDLEDGKSTFTKEVTSEAGQKLLSYIDNQVEYFLKPQKTLRISWDSKREPTTTGKPGKIGTPRKGGSGADKWLFVGMSVSKDNDIYTATEEWLGGDWDEYLYGD